MRSLKLSLICTVKNEKETVADLLESIFKQTRSPDEVVIVDGGSSDGTTYIIKQYSKKLPIKLIVSTGANIAKGRNIAIEKSIHDVIASTDGGCKLDRKWLENIVKPFEENQEIDVVSGVYLPWCKNEFEEIASYLIIGNINNLKPDFFLPSGRSIAFKKKSWETVGGYPEWLDTAEDTLFDLKLKEAGMKFVLARDAVVYWRIRKDVRKIFKQFYNYAVGEGQELLFLQRYIPRYALGLIFLLLASILWHKISFWVFLTLSVFVGLWIKHFRKIRNLSAKRLLTALFIALAIESGVFIGYLFGVFTRIRNSLSL